jgi:hypothetical protein
VNVNVDVNVDAHVIVAALVIGNAIVVVIDAVDDQAGIDELGRPRHDPLE